MLLITGGTGQVGKDLIRLLRTREVKHIFISREGGPSSENSGQIRIDLSIPILGNFISNVSKSGQIAIYCPARLLNILPLHLNYLFIVYNGAIQGKFYPPFPSKVIGRESIEDVKVKTLIIGSRTFDSLIRSNLPNLQSDIISIKSLLRDSLLENL